MKKLLSLIPLVFIIAVSGWAQDTTSFPHAFTGKWKGSIQWFVAGKPPRDIPMQLIIQPADSQGHYTWKIIYGEDGKDFRPYLLKPVDIAAGHWIVDEGDGIVLDSYVHGNSLHSAFTVQNSTIVDNFRLENGKLYVEFFTILLDEKKTSGKGTEEVPLVNSYRIGSYQSGWLTRQN